MDLTVTINDANGNPTILHARSIHIESKANSINVVPATATATVPSVASTTIPQQQVQATQPQATQEPHQQEYTEEYLKNHNDYNTTMQQINEQMKKRYSESPNNTLALAQEHQDMINKANNVANSNLALLQTNNKVFKPPPVSTTASAIAGPAANNSAVTKFGGTRNKRAKRTRKQKRSRKRSTKR